MWWTTRPREVHVAEHREFVQLDIEPIAVRCTCPRGRDHERLTSRMLADAVTESAAA
jgi:hypothetical protein